MSQSQSLPTPNPSTGQKLNLIALLFFFLGALHIYHKLRKGKYWLKALSGFALEQLMKVSLWAVMLVGVAKIWLLAPGF